MKYAFTGSIRLTDDQARLADKQYRYLKEKYGYNLTHNVIYLKGLEVMMEAEDEKK